MSDNQRLERIEDKVDKLVDAMINLVRLEERIQSHAHGMDRLGNRIDSLETDVKVIKEKMPYISIIVAGFGKVGIAVATVIIIGIMGVYFSGKV